MTKRDRRNPDRKKSKPMSIKVKYGRDCTNLGNGNFICYRAFTKNSWIK